MKAVKILFKVLVVVVVLVVAAVLALPLWFGPVAKTAANAVAPGLVRTDFRIGHLALNPYTARFELGAMNLGNPAGYSVKDAVRVGDIIFDAETLSLLTDVIHIEEVTVRDLFVSVVSGGKDGVLNFKQLQYNVAGGKEKYEAAQAEKKAKDGAEKRPEQKAGEKKSKKIIIDRFEISGLTLQLSFLPIRIPSIVLKDIGRRDGGVMLEDAWQQILDGIMKAAGVTGDQLKALGVLSGDAVKTANEAVSRSVEQTAAAMGKATKQLSAGREKVTSTLTSLGSAAGAATGSATDATKSVVDGTANVTVDAIKGGTKAVDEGVKAVGDGAKKALDSLKSLW